MKIYKILMVAVAHGKNKVISTLIIHKRYMIHESQDLASMGSMIFGGNTYLVQIRSVTYLSSHQIHAHIQGVKV